MREGAALFWCITILIVLFAREPDLHDAIMVNLGMAPEVRLTEAEK